MKWLRRFEGYISSLENSQTKLSAEEAIDLIRQSGPLKPAHLDQKQMKFLGLKPNDIVEVSSTATSKSKMHLSVCHADTCIFLKASMLQL